MFDHALAHIGTQRSTLITHVHRVRIVFIMRRPGLNGFEIFSHVRMTEGRIETNLGRALILAIVWGLLLCCVCVCVCVCVCWNKKKSFFQYFFLWRVVCWLWGKEMEKILSFSLSLSLSLSCDTNNQTKKTVKFFKFSFLLFNIKIFRSAPGCSYIGLCAFRNFKSHQRYMTRK